MRTFVFDKSNFFMKTNTQFKNEALAALKGNWGKAVLATLVYALLVGLAVGPSTWQTIETQAYVQEHVSGSSVYAAASLIQDPAYQLLQKKQTGTSAFTFLIEVFLIFPLLVGFANAFRVLLVKADNDILPNTFKIGFSNYWHKVLGMLHMVILIGLWSLLFLIPGIIKGFSYAMTPFILEENPELGTQQAIHRSRMMMRGHKFDLFWLYLSFIGWGILCIFTFGIGYFWLAPYMETAQAAFYEEVKADYAINGGLD